MTTTADDGSVRVAVRVRPFNAREIEMKAKLIISMDGTSTTIVNPENEQPKTFAFDFSYWSHDGFMQQPDGLCVPLPGATYASQQKVFDDIGRDILNNAANGYNCSLFAYGQTGSGKSYSMVGYGANKGIIPICCAEMFKMIESNTDQSKEFQVTVSMLEIYNEQVRDLLNPKVNPPGGLKVRSKPGIGVYVEKLMPVPVSSYKDVEGRMEEGTQNRTIASTKMNATSSRAHTVFTLMFTTVIKQSDGQKAEVTSKINLVDLAGSERAESTGATGDRLKEGCAINQSLSALGNVISALADKAQGKKKVFVPYRNSVLTRLLQDALGGNSKTIMIAALSPADVNFDETLSTLRYADRAKKIKNEVTKNENPTDRIIRELKEENERLMKLLSSKGVDLQSALAEEKGGNQLAEQLAENQRIINELNKSWEQKLQESMERHNTQVDESGAMTAMMARQSHLPNIINLHEDPQLSECVVYVFKDGLTRIGRKDADVVPDVVLSGLSIKKQHCEVENRGGEVTLVPLDNSKTFVNGDLVTKPTRLYHNDRVILGNNYVFRYSQSSDEEDKSGDLRHATWSDAMDEFANKQGLRLQQSFGQINEIEQEETKKRQDLEQKLKEMEEAMARERETARAALEQQKAFFELKMKTGENLSEDEKMQLAAFEESYQNKSVALEQELAKKKEMSVTIVQEHIKRKRQNQKIEEDLASLMPLIADANTISEELNRHVKFEARLMVDGPRHLGGGGAGGAGGVKSGDIKDAKHLKLQIKVTNDDDGSIWHWSKDKFESRFFIIKELYREFQEYGPRDIPLSDDPFWDPPEAIEIGRTYVYLKALSQLVEIENEFNIIDYKGDEQGQLRVEIMPQGLDGEDLDYLSSPNQLLGREVQFVMKVPYARNLPAQYSNRVHICYDFLSQTYMSEPLKIKSCSPQLNHENALVFRADETVRDYLLEDAVVFEVKGFTDAQIAKLDATTQAQQPSHAHAAMCDQCEENAAMVQCVECSMLFCADCNELLHKSAKKAAHNRSAIASAAQGDSAGADAAVEDGGGAAGSVAASPAHVCQQCEEAAAMVWCQDCSKVFCDGCNALLHKSAKKQSHLRQAIATGDSAAMSAGGGAPPEMCGQCEEAQATVKCIECERVFCTGCNELLHKSAKKRDHQRASLLG